jgi:hypothetical protein
MQIGIKVMDKWVKIQIFVSETISNPTRVFNKRNYGAATHSTGYGVPKYVFRLYMTHIWASTEFNDRKR